MLNRPIGLGLAARDDPADVAAWSRQAAELGLDSVWIHDSYFERDAISFATAAALGVSDGRSTGLRIALGAVNPYTRHPLVLAMTGSALDEILPGRFMMALGTGLPLRLGQMGIPYDLATAPERLSTTIDQLRTLWAGERLPSATPGLPPIQPMFAPTHHIPIGIAAYRKELVAVAGAKADAYLARPAESIPSLKGILGRLRRSASEAGRDPDSIETAGYLLSLADSSRREALNRAKREPFVIYMMSILSNVSLARAGFEPELRDRIAAAWRAEDYTLAGNLIPDELLAAFMLCGTRDQIAEGALSYRNEAGLALPLLQPVLQEERQIEEMLAAARIYSEAQVAEPVPAGSAALVVEPVSAAATTPSEVGFAGRLGRVGGAVWEIVRPFAYTASAVPVAIGGAVAAYDGRFAWLPFLEALIAAVFIHSGTNVINEIYDVRKGIDSITSPRASHALVKGRLTERAAFVVAIASLVIAIAVGLHLVYERGPIMLALGLAGVAGGWGYTAPPLQYKYHALGVPLVFLLMGPLMVVGSYFAVTGGWSAQAVYLSIPVGLLVAAILHGNEWRDISEDRRAGIATLSGSLGREWSHRGYVLLVIGAFVTLGLLSAFELAPPMVMLAVLALPFMVRVIRAAELGANGQMRAIARIDLQTARLHFAFGSLMVVGMLLTTVWNG
jgi:1,4-dihydroxy-2-naphthoate octaprenyltransferase